MELASKVGKRSRARNRCAVSRFNVEACAWENSSAPTLELYNAVEFSLILRGDPSNIVLATILLPPFSDPPSLSPRRSHLPNLLRGPIILLIKHNLRSEKTLIPEVSSYYLFNPLMDHSKEDTEIDGFFNRSSDPRLRLRSSTALLHVCETHHFLTEEVQASIFHSLI